MDKVIFDKDSKFNECAYFEFYILSFFCQIKMHFLTPVRVKTIREKKGTRNVSSVFYGILLRYVFKVLDFWPLTRTCTRFEINILLSFFMYKLAYFF